MTDNYFNKLYAMDVSKHIEKKGKFSYLSWPYAVSELCKVDPSATWEVIRFNGLPFLSTECGYFVEVSVTVNNITRSQIHPVLDSANKAVKEPTCFQINTSIQRCLVKAIALHGLGLCIYSGEDLPEESEEKIAERKELEKPFIVPDTKGWSNARNAFIRDGNFDKVFPHARISEENQALIIEECLHAKAA